MKDFRFPWRRQHAAVSMANIPAGLLVVSLATAAIAATPADTCESDRDGALGKYAACMQKAQSKYVSGGSVNSGSLVDAMTSCSEKYLAGWGKSEAKAGTGVCPDAGDGTAVQNFLDACLFTAQDAIGGDSLPADVITCNSSLATCGAESAACGASLDSCSNDLASCTSDCVASLRPPLSTGQVTGYGSGTDGDLQNGAARTFTDNGDGTVTDNVTGLMWEKKSDDGSIHDKDNVYSWGMSSMPFTMNGTAVTTFLAQLNSSNFAGHNDWRLPNRNELLSLTNLEETGPATFPEFNNWTAGCSVTACSATQGAYYWSSTTRKSSAGEAYYVDFYEGTSDTGDKSTERYVRAVRGGS